MTEIVRGLELSRQCYVDIVRPLWDAHFSDVPHSAGLIGRGCEVLGFDDEMSRDHDWGARVMIFVAANDSVDVRERIEGALRHKLPPTFRGHRVSVELHTVPDYVRSILGHELDAELRPGDWLSIPEQALRMLTAGAIFHDQVGLGAIRARLAYYPRDVWLYLLMTGWWRVHPEMNLMGRAGWAGDELGSSLIGARLVSDLMRLCFLMEREYAPYQKWFGTAFARLACGPDLTPVLQQIVRADTWQARESALLVAYERLAHIHNELGITEALTMQVEQMWDRPFQVAWADFPGQLCEQIEDPEVLRIAERWPIGPVDQLRDLLWPVKSRSLLLRLFDGG